MAQPPYDPDALPDDLRSLIPQTYRRSTSIQSKSYSALSPNTPTPSLPKNPPQPALPNSESYSSLSAVTPSDDSKVIKQENLVISKVVRPVREGNEEEVVFKKSSAQVETSVRPQMVRPKSRGGLKPKRGRPYRLMGRFSETEREIVIRKAEAVRMSVNSYLRASALGSDYQPPSDPDLVRELFTMNRELTSQGNNLNQIARQLNGNVITPEQGASMLDVLGRLMVRTHKAVRKALTRGEMEPEQ